MKRKLIISTIVWLTIAAFYFSNYSELKIKNTKEYKTQKKNSINREQLYNISKDKTKLLSIIKDCEKNSMFSVTTQQKADYLYNSYQSTFQCEPVPESSIIADGVSQGYETHNTGEVMEDEHCSQVMFCNVNNPDHPAGYVVKDLKPNEGLFNKIITDLKMGLGYNWYILPKIKIPKDIDYNTNVCRIEIVNQRNEIIKTFELKAMNFRDAGCTYSGDYINEYNINSNGYQPLMINMEMSKQINPEYNKKTNEKSKCNFDIRIYWYKECTMWIDYVKVENDIAYNLIKGVYDNWFNKESINILK